MGAASWLLPCLLLGPVLFWGRGCGTHRMLWSCVPAVLQDAARGAEGPQTLPQCSFPGCQLTPPLLSLCLCSSSSSGDDLGCSSCRSSSPPSPDLSVVEQTPTPLAPSRTGNLPPLCLHVLTKPVWVCESAGWGGVGSLVLPPPPLHPSSFLSLCVCPNPVPSVPDPCSYFWLGRCYLTL